MSSDRTHLKVPTKIEEESVSSISRIMQQTFEAA